MDVFSLFREIEYAFLEIKRGTVAGDEIVSVTALSGVFKLRAKGKTDDRLEVRLSEATLHVHPEDFADFTTADLVGQGVRVDGVNYSISKVTAGTNFDTGVTEHLTFTLERADYAD